MVHQSNNEDNKIFNFGCPPTTNFPIEFCHPEGDHIQFPILGPYTKLHSGLLPRESIGIYIHIYVEFFRSRSMRNRLGDYQ